MAPRLTLLVVTCVWLTVVHQVNFAFCCDTPDACSTGGSTPAGLDSDVLGTTEMKGNPWHFTEDLGSVDVVEVSRLPSPGNSAFACPAELDLPNGLISGSMVRIEVGVMLKPESPGFFVAIVGLFGDLLFHLYCDLANPNMTVNDFVNGVWGTPTVVNRAVTSGLHALEIRVTEDLGYELSFGSVVVATRPPPTDRYPPAAAVKVTVWCKNGAHFCLSLRSIEAKGIPAKNVFDFGSLLPDTSGASPPGPRVFLGIPTHPKNTEKRADIRASYFNHPAFKSGAWTARFFAGRASNPRDNELIRAEAQIYGDIVIDPDLEESYHNIVHKTLTIFRYGANIIGADYVFKADDDTFVHVSGVTELLRARPGAHQYVGKIAFAAGPIRFPENKWYMPHDVWPGWAYPPFAFGCGYLVSRDIAQEISEGHRKGELKMIHLEDVAVGIWVDSLQKRGIPIDYAHTPTFPSIGCVMGGAIAHNVDHNLMRCMWEKVVALEAHKVPFSEQNYCCVE